VPREIFGIPTSSIGLVQQLFGPRVADAMTAPLLALLVGDITRLGLRKLPYGPMVEAREHHQIPVLDLGTIAAVRAGPIAVRPGINRFVPDGVVFTDGRAESFATVIPGPGFRAALSDLLADVPEVLDAAGTPLISGTGTAAPGLYFCGFTVAVNGQFARIG